MKNLVLFVFFTFLAGYILGQQRLNLGQSLLPGQSLISANRNYRLIYQPDGNLVLYRNRDNFPLWSTKTYNQPAGKCIMQSDGNFVMYKPNGEAIWASIKNWNVPDPCRGQFLIMQDDGNAVIYDGNNVPMWSSGTYLEAINDNLHGIPCPNGVSVIENRPSVVPFTPINQRGTSFGMTRNSVRREYNRQNENRNVEANTGRYCTTAIVSEAKGDFEKIVLGNQNDKIFPGAIYYDNAIVEGTYNGPTDLQLQPYDIVTDLFSASSTGSSGIRVNPSLSDVRDGISQLLRRAGSNPRNAANVFLEVNSLSTTEQLAFQLGAGYQGYGVDLEADFNYMKSLSKNVFMAKLVQVYYSVTTNSNVSGRTLIANSTIPSNLIYVSKVNYGRMGYVMISSDASREEIQAALNFRYSGSGNSVSVDARLRYERTLNSLSVKGFFLGGDADRLEIITSPNQLGNFTQYVRNGLRVDPNIPPIPVSYEMKYLNDNATAGVRATTTYTERQCEPGKGIRIKLHNVAIEDHHGGDCSYAWGTAKVEVWETNAQRTPSKKITAAPFLNGDLYWNRPDGRNPLRATINYATVRGRGNIDEGNFNGIGMERLYLLDPKAVNEGRILVRFSLNINTNHKDNDFAALGFHGMNRVETKDYWLKDILVTQDDYTRNKDTTYKYGTLQVGKFCSNTDRVHCFYGFFSILNER